MNRDSISLTAAEITRLLTQAADDRRPAIRLIMKAPASAVIKALRTANTSDVRHILCDVLGFRREARASRVLMEMLDDSAPGVRAAAADALAKLRLSEAGRLLAQRLRSEPDAGVRSMYAAALGAVKHTAAIPLLIASLCDESSAVRSCAAWSLGHLRARDAEPALREGLQHEADDSVVSQMIDALKKIRNRRTARRQRRISPAHRR